MEFNYSLSNILAGIGRGQLLVLNDRIQARQNIFKRYFDQLSKVKSIHFMPEASYGTATRWLTTLTLDPNQIAKKPEKIVTQLDSANIEMCRVWKPMHLQPLYQKYTYYFHEKGRSISDELFEKGICLPSGSNLTETEQDRIIEYMKMAIT